MYYWVVEKCRNPPDQYRFFKGTTQTIQYIFKKMGVQNEEYKKPYYGKPELQIMIDDEMSQPIVRIAHMEQQHLAWIFGCLCGIRPGSLGSHPDDESRHLRWNDITIRREITSDGGFEGRFTACCVFRYLKDRNTTVRKPSRFQQLRLTVRSARSPDHIPFSLPHRLLTILIRRGLLRDYTTVEELFNGQDVNVIIKPEGLDQPVLLKGKSHGYLQDSPHNASGFTIYMKKVALRCGLGNGTMYAWRNKAATEVARAVGPDKARMFLNHSTRSRVLEEYYDEAEYDLDVTAIALAEDHVAGAQSLRDDSSPALYRATIPPLGTPVHKAFVGYLVSEDTSYRQMVIEGRDEDAKLRWYRLRRQANKAWEEYHRKLSVDHLTMDEVNERTKELRSAPRLMSNVRAFMSNMMIDADTGEEWGGIEDDDDPLAVDMEDQLGIDFPTVEDDVHTSNSDEESSDEESSDGESSDEEPSDEESSGEEPCTTATSVIEETVNVDEGDDVPYHTQIKAFMLYLLDLDECHFQHPKRPEELTCSLCREDETVPEERKNYVWQGPFHLARHQKETYHSDFARFKRGMNIRYKRDGCFICPYANCGAKYPTGGQLTTHIRYSLKLNKAGEIKTGAHADAIRAAGWGSEGFEGKSGKPVGKVKRPASDEAVKPVSKQVATLGGIKRPASDEVVEARPMKMKMPQYEASILLGTYTVPEKMWADVRPCSVESTRLALERSLESRPGRAALVTYEQQSFRSYLAQNPGMERDWAENEGFSWNVNIQQFREKLREDK